MFIEITSILEYISKSTEILKPDNTKEVLEQMLPNKWKVILTQAKESEFSKKFKKFRDYFNMKF
jgi:hypothetical protein